MLASAEGASGEKDEFCAKVLLNSCVSLKVLKTGGILKMFYKYARFVHLQNQENGARERRRRERRKFGAFYTRFTQKCFLYPSACQRALKTRSFFENVQRTSALCAPPEPTENGARERRRRERRKFEAFYANFTQKRLLHYFAWHKVHKKHTVLLEYSKGYECEGFARASRTKRKRCRERRRRERRKFGA